MTAGPITYTEKGWALHEAVYAAGQRLWQENGTWLADDAATVQGLIDAFDPLTQARAEKSAAVEQRRAALLAAGLDYTGPDGVTRTFQIDAISRQAIASQSTYATVCLLGKGSWPSEFYWIAADNSLMALASPDQMLAFETATAAYVAGLVLRSRALLDAIASAQTQADLDGIDPAAGWPDAAPSIGSASDLTFAADPWTF